MNPCVRPLLLASLAVMTLACGADNSLAANPDDTDRTAQDNSPVQTDATSYRLLQVQGETIGSVQAHYRNETGRTLLYPSCGVAVLRRTGPDSLRTLFRPFACSAIGGEPPSVLRAGESMTINVPLGSPDQPRMNPPLQPEWLVGTMRVLLNLCAMNSNGQCMPLPDRERQSKPFEVHY